LWGFAFGILDVHDALGAARTGFVDDHDGLLHQLVFHDDALNRARHLVGSAASPGRHDELDRFGGLPIGQCGCRDGAGQECAKERLQAKLAE